MRKEYLETLLAQIQEKRARASVLQEVESHIDDQKQAYLSEGMLEELAEEKAVADMGDPIETGIALNQIHRPKPAWGMLAAIAVLCIVGILLQYTAGQLYNQSEQNYFGQQCLFTVIGLCALYFVYLMDYTRIAKYGRWICAGILLFIFVGTHSGIFFTSARHYTLQIPGFEYYSLSLEMILYLYVPLYGAVLYSYRKACRSSLWKVLLYTLLPIYFAYQYASAAQVFNLAIILPVMFCVGALNGWYGILPSATLQNFHCSVAAKIHLSKNTKKTTGSLAAVLLSVLCILVVYLECFAPAYQKMRIQAWLNPTAWNSSISSISNLIRNILSDSQFVGKTINQTVNQGELNFSADFILTYLFGQFGILAAIALVILVAVLSIKLLQISLHQKNKLGMIISLGCSLIFVIQSVEYILVNLGMLPPSGLYFPLISYGGNGMLQTCLLLGLLLSTYRYQNVVQEAPTMYTDGQ